jgi:hypothetical protein
MPKGPFLPSQFIATQWSTERDKADFANSVLHFIESEFKQTLFTRKFYERLSNTFGNIAHYNLTGFWEEWFTTEADQVRFLENLLRWPCYGDPKFTFSDVERALQREIGTRGYLFRYQAIADAALRSKEVAMLEKLEAKYRTLTSVEAPVERTGFDQAEPINPPSVRDVRSVQASLF